VLTWAAHAHARAHSRQGRPAAVFVRASVHADLFRIASAPPIASASAEVIRAAAAAASASAPVSAPLAASVGTPSNHAWNRAAPRRAAPRRGMRWRQRGAGLSVRQVRPRSKLGDDWVDVHETLIIEARRAAPARSRPSPLRIRRIRYRQTPLLGGTLQGAAAAIVAGFRPPPCRACSRAAPCSS
jgi:hypothetical protein